MAVDPTPATENGTGELPLALAANATAAPEAPTRKRCFLISPIGSRASDIRKRSDDVRNYVVAPAVNPLGYRVIRADDIAEPGMIMQQVINEIAVAELVVADLTHLNPNVFYELAVRHQTAKPIVTIAENDTINPFDLNQVRTIYFDHKDLASVHECKAAIREQVLAMERETYKPSNPILQSIRLQELVASRDPQVHEDLPVFEMFNDIQAQLGGIGFRISRLENYSRLLQRGSEYEHSVEEYLDAGGSESGTSTLSWRLKGTIEALIRAMEISRFYPSFISEVEEELQAAFEARDLARLERLQSILLGALQSDTSQSGTSKEKPTPHPASTT